MTATPHERAVRARHARWVAEAAERAEPRAIGAFILAHPNIAGVQSYHNAGGMILRGPGAANLPEYAAEDLQVYDELGRNGEYMLPYYRYMIIHKDLYTVHGGFVNWTAEGLGIISFTNELWNDGQYNQKPEPAPTDDTPQSPELLAAYDAEAAARDVVGERAADAIQQLAFVDEVLVVKRVEVGVAGGAGEIDRSERARSRCGVQCPLQR